MAEEKEPILKDFQIVGQLDQDGRDRQTVRAGRNKDGKIIMRVLPKRKKNK